MANGSDMKSHIITNGATNAFVYKVIFLFLTRIFFSKIMYDSFHKNDFLNITISLKDFFGWINGDKLFFGRKTDTSSKYVAYTLNNLKDVAVFDSSLEKDVRGI